MLRLWATGAYQHSATSRQPSAISYQPSGLRDGLCRVPDAGIAEKTRFKKRTNEAVILLKIKQVVFLEGLKSRHMTENRALITTKPSPC
jgi:hypothetical protein